MIGLLSDSHGDLEAFDAAYELLRKKGARRFIFPGGAAADLDAWIALRQKRPTSGGYSDTDFLADVSHFLANEPPVPRPPAFGDRPDGAIPLPAPPEHAAQVLRDRFVCVADPAEGTPPPKAMDMLGDALLCVVYDKNALDREDLLNATVFVHGGEAEPKVVQIGPRYFVSPGSLSGVEAPTCALLEAVDRSLRFSAFRLDGAAVGDGRILSIERRTKLSVK